MTPATAGRSKSWMSSPPWLAPAAVVAAVLLAYWNSLGSPFLFDDTGAVVNNPTIRHLGSLAALSPPQDGSTTTGRPVVNLSFALNYAVSGNAVWSYHALNLLIHAAAALALLGVVRRTLPGPAFLAALLWAVHPLQTESVTCIAQRTESLCGLFYLLTFYGLARGATAPRAAPWLALSVLACLAGMGTKEVMVTAPVLVLLFDRTFLAGSFAGAWRQRRGYYAALAGTWLLLAWLVWRSGGERGAAAGFGHGISGWNYLLQQCAAIVLYLKLSVWPHPLVLDYGTAVAPSWTAVWWQGLVVLALLAGTGWALWRRPVLGFLGAWFFIILAPSSSFVPLVTQTMAEHRMYLPLAAVVCLVVFAARRHLGPRAEWALAAAAVGFAGLTVARNHDYRDTVAIWRDSADKYPLNPRAHNNLGWALQAQGKPAEANVHFARAVELQPDYVTAHYTWGVALLDQRRTPEAIAQFEAAVQGEPNHADAYVNLGNALMQVRRTAEAIGHYETALRLRPGADVHYDLGVALLELGRTAEAEQHLLTARQANPRLPHVAFQLGRAAEATGRPVEAEQRYAEALQLDPENAAAHRQLGFLLVRRDQLAPAGEHLRAVVRLQPRDAGAHAILGDLLMLQGKPREAVACYEESLRLQPDDPATRESLKQAKDALR